MGLLGSARRVALTARYVTQTGSQGGEVRLVPGDPAVTARLQEILQVPTSATPPEVALAIFSIAPGADPSEVAARMADRAVAGERSMAVIIGLPHERAQAERALLDTGVIEMSRIAHVAALDQRGEDEVMDGILRALPSDRIVAAARTNPELRRMVTRKVLSKNARTAGVLASGALGAKAGMVALGFLQVRMLGDLAAVSGRNVDREDAVDIAAVAGSSVIWRIVGRTAAARTGHPALARGAVAYAATKSMGLVARQRFSAGGSSSERFGTTTLVDKAKKLAVRAKSLKQG